MVLWLWQNPEDFSLNTELRDELNNNNNENNTKYMYESSINKCFIFIKKLRRIVNTYKNGGNACVLLSADVQFIFILLLWVFIRSFRKSSFSTINIKSLFEFPWIREKRHLQEETNYYEIEWQCRELYENCVKMKSFNTIKKKKKPAQPKCADFDLCKYV